ncbi:hypothetical protein H9Q13_00935 [Pontibacter sp. JH31]|uniref:Uncharacterized protein n=1 Tax=Pontibacter aquaedesilientis TaxID=2766980 RepID=A0ABR7XCU4_9BACT|nr:hypothetical protein [Pontibacter aquaedesilientis]MBD1395716.1 hypothetical protein [Pontibacter aquaedesilientis]
MIRIFRSFFGLEQESTRTVMAHPNAADASAVQYIRASNARLNALHQLYDRYKGTVHADKILAVFEKTKLIHNYLVTRKRVHELEMFHVQNTEHFISTFTTVINVHERHIKDSYVPDRERGRAQPLPHPPTSQPKPTVSPQRQAAPQPQRNPPQPFETKVEQVLKRIESETIKGIYTAQKVTEMVKRVANQAPMGQSDTMQASIPALAAPVVAIDTYSRVFYATELEGGSTMSREISFTASDTDKDVFLQHVARKLGVDKSEMNYVGNAMLAIPDTKGPSPARHVPIVHWRGFPYAVSLMDYRLFPVRMHRKSL